MTTAEMIRKRVQEAPAGTFIRPAELPGTRPAILTALSRLHADGELVRVRNGLYWKGLRSRFGSGRPNLLDAAVVVAGTGAGPTGWSATQVLGLSTQLPAVPEVAVAGPVPTLEGVRFHRRNNAARHELNFYEVALMEALRTYPRYAEVGIDRVAAAVRRLEKEGKVEWSKIERVARSEHSPKLRQNLARVDELLGRDRATA
jgi:hypothetical protein